MLLWGIYRALIYKKKALCRILTQCKFTYSINTFSSLLLCTVEVRENLLPVEDTYLSLRIVNVIYNLGIVNVYGQ